MLAVSQKPLVIDGSKKPYVILMVGINGGENDDDWQACEAVSGARQSVMLAAGDTFRAAGGLAGSGVSAIIFCGRQLAGADSASVLFDAVQAAACWASNMIADAAGRLHNKDNLMQELEKVVVL